MSKLALPVAFVLLVGGCAPQDMHEAARSGRLTRVQRLLREDPALVNYADAGGLTPLHYAIAHNHQDVVDYLVDNEADLEARTGRGRLEVSHSGGSSTGERPGLTPLHLAVCANRRGIVETLLAAGCNVDARTAANELTFSKAGLSYHIGTDRSDWTALHMAAYGGQITVGKLLLEGGADVNTPNDHGESPIHLAARMPFRDSAWEDYPKMVELLLDHGADIEMRIKGTGSTPLQSAAWYGHMPTATVIINAGAELDIHSACGLGLVDQVVVLPDCCISGAGLQRSDLWRGGRRQGRLRGLLAGQRRCGAYG